MKICFVNPFGYSVFSNNNKLINHQSIGGAEVQLYYLSTFLASQTDFDVHMLVEEEVRSEKEVLQGVTIHFISPPNKIIRNIRDLLPFKSKNYFRKLKEIDADIYIQRGGSLLTGDVGFFCKKYNKKFVFMSAHRWDCTDKYFKTVFSFNGKYYLKGLESANLVFTQCLEHKELLKSYCDIPSVIYRAVFPKLNLTSNQEIKENNILWVGRCINWKQPELFIEIAKKFSDYNHTMICPPVPGNYKYFQLIKTKSVEIPNLRFIEYIPFNEIHHFFNDALLYINTSVEEGFPNTFIQSTRSRVPILSLNANPDNMLNEHKIGFCSNGDMINLQDRLSQLLTNKVIYKEYSKNCQTYFSKYHTFEKNALIFYSHIKKL